MAKLEIGKRYWLDETNTSHGKLVSLDNYGDTAEVLFDEIEGDHPYFDEDCKVGFFTNLDDEEDFELYTA